MGDAGPSGESWGEWLQRYILSELDEADPLGDAPRPLTVKDFGTTTGGVVTVAGSIWFNSESRTLGVRVDMLEARGFGRDGGGVVNQSIDALVAAAREKGAVTIDIWGTMGNKESTMFFRAMRSLPYTVVEVEYLVETNIIITGF